MSRQLFGLRERLVVVVFLAILPLFVLALYCVPETGAEQEMLRLAWLAIVALLAVAGTWIACNEFVVRPVRTLGEATRRFSAGDLSARVGEPRTAGELGGLQRAFDEMATSVQQSAIQLREAEGRYRQMVERLPAITYVAEFGEKGAWQYVSPQIEAMLGFAPAEWLADAQSWFRQILPEDRDRVLSEESRCRAEGKPFRSEYRLAKRSGETVWVRDDAVLVNDEMGRSAALSGIIHDITQLKCVEQALRESEERFRCLSASSPMGIFLTDVNGACVYANPRWRNIFGLSLAQSLGDGWAQSVNAEERERVKSEWLESTRAGHEFSGEFRVHDRQGVHRWVQMRSGVMVSDRGERLGYVGTVEDITERKAADDALRDTNRVLEQTLRELRETQHHIIQQERLRALGQLASGVAHDFNNALAKIMGFTELLMSSPDRFADPVRLVGYLERIRTAAQDAANVVQRLREFYRKRDDTEVFQPLNLQVVLQQAVALTEPKWRQQAQATGVTVQVHTDLGAVPVVAGNDADLREALTNLIFNAVDAIATAGRDGSVTLRARTEAGQAVVEIADTGSGMTEDVRRHCFEPFYTTKGDRGTGLGLASVYGIVQRHGGQITVSSEAGKGTTFRIVMPAHVPSANRVETVAVVEEAAVRPLRVLLAEDEPALRDIEAEYLMRDGHSVVTARNGREAFEKFLAGQFDLVVADRAMPEMNGDQLVASIRGTSSVLPVIMVTGFDEGAVREGQGTTKPDMVLGKPLTQATLRRAVASAMRRNPQPIGKSV